MPRETPAGSLGLYLARRRKAQGLSLAEVALRTGIPVLRIEQVESGRPYGPASAIRLAALCDALDVSPRSVAVALAGNAHLHRQVREARGIDRRRTRYQPKSDRPVSQARGEVDPAPTSGPSLCLYRRPFPLRHIRPAMFATPAEES